MPHEPMARVAARSGRSIRGGRVDSIDGSQISFLRLGHGPRIVCLHGSFGTGLSWFGVARSLSERFEFVLVDRRGHGASSPGHAPAALEREVEDLISVIEEVGPIRSVVGHSFGALIALRAALAHPGILPRLALYEPPLRFHDEALPRQALSAFRADVAAGEYENALLSFLPHLGTSEAELALLRAQPFWPSLVSLAPVEAENLSIELEHVPEDYRSIEEPILLLTGSESRPTLRKATEELCAVVPNAEITTLEGQSHYATVQAPDQLARALEPFISARFTSQAP